MTQDPLVYRSPKYDFVVLSTLPSCVAAVLTSLPEACAKALVQDATESLHYCDSEIWARYQEVLYTLGRIQSAKMLENHLGDILDFWLGRREPRGVDDQNTGRCRWVMDEFLGLA